MTGQEWFYLVNGQQTGPVSWEGLLAGLRTNLITEDTMIWASHLPMWTPLKQCLHAQPTPEAPLPPPRPSFDLQNPNDGSIAGPRPWKKVWIIAVGAVILSVIAAFAIDGPTTQWLSRESEIATSDHPKGVAKPVAGDPPYDVDLRLRAATNMIDEGRLNTEEDIKRVKVKLESDLDRSNGKQLTSYAVFLWAAYEAEKTSIEARQSFFDEGMAALRSAEDLRWTKAYFVDGSWSGNHNSISTSVFLGENDPRSSTWPILTAIAKWQEGTAKGDPSCRFLMDQLSPSWEAAQGTLREIETLEIAFETKKKGGAPRASLSLDLSGIDEKKMRWISESGMVPKHLADHPQHSLPCWDWVSEKSGVLIGQWDQAHPQQ